MDLFADTRLRVVAADEVNTEDEILCHLIVKLHKDPQLQLDRIERMLKDLCEKFIKEETNNG